MPSLTLQSPYYPWKYNLVIFMVLAHRKIQMLHWFSDKFTCSLHLHSMLLC